MPVLSFHTAVQAAEFAVEAISNQANAGSKLDLVRLQLQLTLLPAITSPSHIA